MKSIPNPIENKPPEVLIIDDEENICEFFKDLFDMYNVKIDTEMSGASGLKKGLEKMYNLIFLDVMLGDMNGIEVLKAIKQKFPETKVVMISAYLTAEIIEKALKIGADGYLYKPVEVRDILSLTQQHIKL